MANEKLPTPDRKTAREKKIAARNAAKARRKERGGLKEYFKGVKTEMKKVIWPTRKETISYTGVVIVTCAFFALLFWGFDSGFLAVLKAVLNITI